MPPDNEQRNALAAITAADDQLKAALVRLGRAAPMYMEKLHQTANSKNPARVRALSDDELIAFAAAARIGITEVARAIMEQDDAATL